MKSVLIAILFTAVAIFPTAAEEEYTLTNITAWTGSQLAALPHFDRKLKGFLTAEAVLIGVETRTSAPLRIIRSETGESVSHPGLFPAGEGAGYAGGIMSAALDGLRAADQLVKSVVN